MPAERTRKKQENRYHHGDLRAALVSAAAALAAERGSAALSLREVARRAGVSHAAPYHHFRDREDLLAEVAVVGFQKLEQAQGRAEAEAGPDPFDRLEALGVAYVLFADAEPHYFRVMFQGDLNHPKVGAAKAGPLRRLIETVAEAQRADGRIGVDPLAPALVCLSAIHGLAHLWVDGTLRSRPRDLRAMARYVARIVVGALRTGQHTVR